MHAGPHARTGAIAAGLRSAPMGHLEQFAQQTFADETERITAGAAGWQDPPEIRLEKCRATASSWSAGRTCWRTWRRRGPRRGRTPR
jgi:hypothetical protein